jgi:hypothetical protein
VLIKIEQLRPLGNNRPSLPPEQHHVGLAKKVSAMDRAIFCAAGLDVALGIGQRLERLADDRPALATRDMLELVAKPG